MEDGGHRENGRSKAEQYKAAQNHQWLMQHQPTTKHVVTMMAERDAAVQERNLAISEKKAALAEREMAILQRDAAIQERNAVMVERDNAITALQYRGGDIPMGCGVGVGIGMKLSGHHHHHHHTNNGMSDAPYGPRDAHVPDALSICAVTAKGKGAKRGREAVKPSGGKKPVRRSGKHEEIGCGTSELSKQLVLSRPEWKGQDLGLNQVAFDDSMMPAPVCSCTGTLRQCYKWGNGGWQSSCCTTTISAYPLPSVPNKRHARIGGRKMSGSAFNKLLSRLASDGHDLSCAVDLKDHWARHGTNRYITIK